MANVWQVRKDAVGLVMSRPGDLGELVHLAANRSDAEDWLTRHGCPEAELQEVTVPAQHTGRAA